MQAAHLNKRQVLTGETCARALYLDSPPAPPDPAREAVLEEGRQVGVIARDRYPGGTLVGHLGFGEALRDTQGLLADRQVPAIFEGAFEHGGLRVRPDILVRQGEAWDLIEVKASVSLKEDHLRDVALTRFVVSSSGLPIGQVKVLLVSRNFRLGMPLVRFLEERDVTQDIPPNPGDIPARVAALLDALSRPSPPEVPVGLHCRSCEHADTCLPPDHVLNLPNLREGKYGNLCKGGMLRIQDIPEPFPLTPIQKRMADAVKRSAPQTDPGLSEALRQVSYPLYFLDFESVTAAYPLYPDIAPFESLPTQFAVHLLPRPGAPAHRLEFLHEGASDPSRPVADSLLALLGRHGSIVVYSGYERRMITDLARRLPDRASALADLLPRLYDLCEVIRRHYYHPRFGGSFSIKRTLPALVPELDYDGLAIANGAAASVAYREMIAAGTGAARRREIARDLREYCAHDSLAMVRLFEALGRIA